MYIRVELNQENETRDFQNVLSRELLFVTQMAKSYLCYEDTLEKFSHLKLNYLNVHELLNIMLILSRSGLFCCQWNKDSSCL